MKTYRIVITSQAEAALNSFVDYIAIDERMPETAERWFQSTLFNNFLIAVRSPQKIAILISPFACVWLTIACFFTGSMSNQIPF